MRVSDLFPSRYLKGVDLPDNVPVAVTISEVTEEVMADGTTKGVLYFAGKKKGLVLNKTNAETIGEKHGDELSAWVGKQILLRREMTSYAGRRVPCIRVEVPPLRQPAAPAPHQQQQQQPTAAQQLAEVADPNAELAADAKAKRDAGDDIPF